jgi:hypothetical protein
MEGFIKRIGGRLSVKSRIYALDAQGANINV